MPRASCEPSRPPRSRTPVVRHVPYTVLLRLEPRSKCFTATVPGYPFLVHGRTERAAVERARDALGRMTGVRMPAPSFVVTIE